MYLYKKFFIVFLAFLLLAAFFLACSKIDEKRPISTNPISSNSPSPLENTGTKEKETTSGELSTNTPTLTASPSPTNSLLDIINFSHTGGFYDSAFSLSLSAPSGYKIFYTLDGTDPKDHGIEYKNKIKINDSQTQAIGPITRNIRSYGASKTMRATVVRAYAKKGLITTPLVSNTYFVANNLADKYKLPYVSIFLEPETFMNPNGIYVKPWINNVPFSSKRRTNVFVEFYNDKGLKQESLFAEMSMQGNGSLGATKKSMRFYFKKDIHIDSNFYPNRLYYDIFDGRAKDNKGNVIDSFKRIVLRNSGNDYNMSMLRDSLIQNLSSSLSIDYQESQPTMVFINGEFWGLYNARERYDDKYYNSHYGIKSKNLVVLKAPSPLQFADRSYTEPYEISEGEQGDQVPWETLLAYLDSHNLANENYYKHVADQVDILSLMDIHIANIFFGNNDWPGNNVRVWRNKDPNDPSGLDTKWRFSLMDTDMGAAFNNGPEHNFLGHAFARETGWLLTKLMTSMLQNEDFKTAFVERFLLMIDTIYHPDNTIPVLDKMVFDIKDAMALEVARWPQNSLTNWQKQVNSLSHNKSIRRFLLTRGNYIKEQLYTYFGVFPKEVSLVYDSSKASVKLDNKTVSEGAKLPITSGQKVNISVSLKSGNEFVSVIATGASGKQEVFNTLNPTITLTEKTTITVLVRKQGLSVSPQIVTGSRSVYVINNKGDLYAWGSNELGQNGLYTSGLLTKATLIRTGVVMVSSAQGGNVGDSPHTLILTDDNILYSIGNNSYGQLGRGGDSTIFMRMNFNVAGKIKSISAGHDHTIVLMENGDLYGVGNNQMGQLGNQEFGGAVTSFIKLASNVKTAVAGRRHTVYVDNSGKAYALGDNRWNKFTRSITEKYPNPVLIMENIKEVYSGEHQTLLLTNSSDLYYLGWRNHTTLQAGQADGKPHKLMSNVKKANMKDEHALILTNDNKAYGWGLNSFSQVTSGTSLQSYPVLIDNNVMDIAAGSWFSVLLYQDGRVVTWGKNESAIAGSGQVSSIVGKTIAMRL